MGSEGSDVYKGSYRAKAWARIGNEPPQLVKLDVNVIYGVVNAVVIDEATKAQKVVPFYAEYLAGSTDNNSYVVQQLSRSPQTLAQTGQGPYKVAASDKDAQLYLMATQRKENGVWVPTNPNHPGQLSDDLLILVEEPFDAKNKTTPQPYIVLNKKGKPDDAKITFVKKPTNAFAVDVASGAYALDFANGAEYKLGSPNLVISNRELHVFRDEKVDPSDTAGLRALASYVDLLGAAKYDVEQLRGRRGRKIDNGFKAVTPQ